MSDADVTRPMPALMVRKGHAVLSADRMTYTGEPGDVIAEVNGWVRCILRVPITRDVPPSTTERWITRGEYEVRRWTDFWLANLERRW